MILIHHSLLYIKKIQQQETEDQQRNKMKMHIQEIEDQKRKKMKIILVRMNHVWSL